MKRFQLGLEREVRPQRPVGKNWIGDRNKQAKRAADYGGGEESRLGRQRPTTNTLAAHVGHGGDFETIPKERKQKRRGCSSLRHIWDGRQRNRVSSQSPGGTPGGPGQRTAVMWARRLWRGSLRKAAAANGQNTSQELPGAVFHIHSLNSVHFWFGMFVSLNYVLWGTSEIRGNTN